MWIIYIYLFICCWLGWMTWSHLHPSLSFSSFFFHFLSFSLHCHFSVILPSLHSPPLYFIDQLVVEPSRCQPIQIWNNLIVDWKGLLPFPLNVVLNGFVCGMNGVLDQGTNLTLFVTNLARIKEEFHIWRKNPRSQIKHCSKSRVTCSFIPNLDGLALREVRRRVEQWCNNNRIVLNRETEVAISTGRKRREEEEERRKERKGRRDGHVISIPISKKII